MMYEPAGSPEVFQTVEYGAVVSSAPTFWVFTLNRTPATPMLSPAVAESVTELPSVTVVPEEGAVRETVGAEVSAGAQYDGLFMLTVTADDAVTFPAASYAFAISECV